MTSPNPSVETAGRHRCSACGAPVTWNPERQALACDFCGGAEAVEVPPAQIAEYAIAEALAQPGRRGLDRPVRRLRCGTCGATVDFDPGVVAGRCAFCGAATVSEEDGESAVWRPESLLPFAVTQDEAQAAYAKWLGGLWFRPSDLKKRARLEKIAGVYLPFWTFDGRADSWWTAEAGYHYWEEERYTDESGEAQTRRVQKTRWEPASGRHHHLYDDVLVYASKGLPRALCEKIEPFPTDRLVPYDPRFLAGFGAEEYVLDAKEGWAMGQERMERAEHQACEQQVPGDEHRGLRVRTSISEATFKHVMLPVWIAAYRYQDESYRFLVNGQTGEVQGYAPWSWIKITLAVLAALAVIGAIVWGVQQ